MKCRSRVQRCGRASQAPGAGFTLIEIMVVIGILAIVLAMGVPPFVRSLQKDSLRQAVSDIEEACGKARAQAILRGVPTELIIRATDGQLTVAPTPETRAGQTAAGGDSTEQPADAFVPQSPVFSARLREDMPKAVVSEVGGLVRAIGGSAVRVIRNHQSRPAQRIINRLGDDAVSRVRRREATRP